MVFICGYRQIFAILQSKKEDTGQALIQISPLP